MEVITEVVNIVILVNLVNSNFLVKFKFPAKINFMVYLVR